MKFLQKLLTLLLVVLPGLLTVSAAAAANCEAPAHREFDFWIGNWEVRTPAGVIAGNNRIKAEYNGCVVHERYETATGYRGESLNVYDAGRKRWHQTWVDNKGGLLLLEGGVRGGSMVLEGRAIAVDGKLTRHRISWRPRDDGTVTQLWESSEDEGQWSVVFYGIYRRK